MTSTRAKLWMWALGVCLSASAACSGSAETTSTTTRGSATSGASGGASSTTSTTTTASGSTSSSGGGPTIDATIKVDRTTKVGTIGPAFAGLSYEKNHLNVGFFTPSNASLIGLFKRLGPSVLRIGANSVDKTTWSQTGTGSTTGLISPPDVDALAGFLQATGWKVIYGVNMAAGDTNAAAAEAKYAATALGASLYGFEIGNEPDLYHSNGDRPTTWTYADFLAQWKMFETSMHVVAPNAEFTGPASAYNYKMYAVPFAKDAAADVTLLTQHYYRGSGMSAMSTLDELLQPDPALLTELDALRVAATANHISLGYRLAEANSFYGGGAPGISDGYGTALWVIDFLFTNAIHGSSGVNFHGGGNSTGYTPIADKNSAVVEARPDYYGMFAFTLAGQGDIFATQSGVMGINFTSYAVGAADGSTNIVLVNKDSSQTVHATVDLGKAGTTGALTVLTGPSLGTTMGFTIGGATIAPDGTWTPTATPSVPVSGNTFVVDVPPISAAIVHAQ